MKRKTSSVENASSEDDSSGLDSEEEDTLSSKTPVIPTIGRDMSGAPPTKVAKLSKGDLYKPPTNDEINQLKETENLFHSTLFRMQISELLTEVQLKSKRRQQIEEAINSVKNILLDMKQGKKFEFQEDKWLKKSGVRLPLHELSGTSRMKGSFQFLPPCEVSVTGSYLVDTCVRPDIHADLLLHIPKESFDTKDYLNHRYMRKRALYLSRVAMVMKKQEEIESVKFTYLHGNHLKPILVICVKVAGHKSVRIHVHAVPERDTFKLNRFHVAKNNIRSSWFHDKQQIDEQASEDTGSATPFYNCSVLEDMTSHDIETGCQGLQTSSSGVKEGIILLKIWLRQRGLDYGHGGFSGFIMSMYVSYLLQEKKVNPYMSSYQVMRNTFLRLSQSDWTVNGISLCHVTSDANMPTLMEFQQHSDVVFVDTTGYLNLCYAMNKSMFQRVQHEALLAIEMLEDRMGESFDKLFMKKIPVPLKFDHIFHVSSPIDGLKSCVDKLKLSSRYMDYGGHTLYTCLPSLMDTLGRGLGPRIKLLQLEQHTTPSWEVTDAPPSYTSIDKLTFGMLLDSQYAFNVLDRGPSADSSEAASFRQFWGSKSELRRFQDGGICEAVLWLQDATVADKQLVCGDIIKYLLERHLGISADHVHYQAGHLHDLLHLPVTLTNQQSDKSSLVHYGTGEEQTTSVIHVYDQLCKLVRTLGDLPLRINAIQGVAACFRYTEVFPPLPCTCKHLEGRAMPHGVKQYIPTVDTPCPVYTPALKVVCTLEGSGKWPDDLEAMRRLKAAFHIQLGQAIKSTYNLPVRITTTHVDVLKDHYVFRLVLAYTREIALLKTIKTPDGMMKKRDTEEALTLEKNTLALPRLTSTLHGIQLQHSSFSTTVRLAKRWVCSQLLGDYIDTVAIELIVCSLYMRPTPHTVPRSGLVGFERFLDLLSTFDWKTYPLFVNLNYEFTETDQAEISTRFNKERSTLPLMFISTPLDKYSSHWTKRTPVPAILQRLVLLAQKSTCLLQQQVMMDRVPDLKPLFRPALDIYDVVIHLNSKQLPRQHECVDVTTETHIPKYDKKVDEDRFPVTDFDPVKMFLKELRETFDDLCLLFHDEHGGCVVGVLWKPQALQPRDFKVSHINYSKLQTAGSGVKDVALTPNMDAILEDIKVIGQGFVKSIEVKDKAVSVG